MADKDKPVHDEEEDDDEAERLAVIIISCLPLSSVLFYLLDQIISSDVLAESYFLQMDDLCNTSICITIILFLPT